jgi:rRNA maturation endonuclease Nob1
MQVAVTDACIFIDLLDLKITDQFFKLDLEIHTTYEVWDELDENQQEVLNAYRSVEKLTVHVLEPDDKHKMAPASYPRGLSPADISVLYIAEKIDAILLSSDGTVRKFAPKRSIKIHGLFWVLDQLVEQDHIIPSKAVSLLKSLFKSNLMYKNNIKLWKEAEKRINLWKD